MRQNSKTEDAERQKILDEIKAELDAVTEARKKGTKPFLEFLNETYLKKLSKEIPLTDEAL